MSDLSCPGLFSAPVARRLVLASASPRRQELLLLLGIPFSVLPASIDERPGPKESVTETVLRLAREKAGAVAGRAADAAVLAADTLVELDGKAVGKPESPEAARRSLCALRGRAHSVLTGICLRVAEDQVSHVVSTRVLMRPYGDAEIERTIALGTPFDKAGAYAIQDELFRPVESIGGCYCNVMGLPLWTIFELLQSTGLDVPLLAPDVRRPGCANCPLRI